MHVMSYDLYDGVFVFFILFSFFTTRYLHTHPRHYEQALCFMDDVIGRGRFLLVLFSDGSLHSLALALAYALVHEQRASEFDFVPSLQFAC